MLKRPRWVEIIGWQIYAGVFQVGEEQRPHTRGAEATLDLTPLVGRFLDELVHLLHLQDFAFHAGNFANAGYAPATIRQPLQLNNNLHSRSDLTPDARYRHRGADHSHHLLEPLDRVARCVGMDGGHRSLVTGVHCLQHVEGFIATTLTDDDTVRTHAQCILDQLALA